VFANPQQESPLSSTPHPPSGAPGRRSGEGSSGIWPELERDVLRNGTVLPESPQDTQHNPENQETNSIEHDD
jgi:hypothetical protein